MRGYEAFLSTLEELDLTTIFGNPGSTEVPWLDELPRYEKLRFVLTLHESIAVNMADGYAQARRSPSVASVHASPGLLHSLGALYNAKIAGSPVIAIAGQVDSRILSRDPFLASDIVSAAKGYAKWTWELRRADEIRYVLRRAAKVAMDPPTGPVMISVPKDILDEEVKENYPLPTDYRNMRSGFGGDDRSIQRAVELLLKAESPAMICGPEVRWYGAVDNCVKLAELLAMKVYDDIRYGVYYPVNHHCYFGFFTREDLKSHDLILVVGQRMFYEITREQIPLVGEGAELIHITSDPMELGKNYEASCCIFGDSATVMEKLLESCSKRLSTESEKLENRRKSLENHKKELLEYNRKELEEYFDRKPVSAHRVVNEVNRVFGDGDELNVVVEAVTSQPFIRRLMKSFNGYNYFVNPGATLGWGVAASVGVKLAEEDKKVLCFSGDGAFMYYPQSLWTAARVGVKVVVIVMNNRAYMNDKLHIQSRRGTSFRAGAYDAVEINNPPVTIEQIAKGIGCNAATVRDPGELSTALELASSSSSSFVVDVHIDPSIVDRRR